MNQDRSLIEKYISNALLVLILLFAITSTGNVTEYIHLYHKGWTGITLGLTFGVTVFTCAYIAATGKTKMTRTAAIVIGSIFGIASAFFQMNIYMTGGATREIAATLSFIPIMAGEVGLAILEHFYSRDSIAQNEHPIAVAQSAIAPAVERAIAPRKSIQLNVQSSAVEQSVEHSIAQSERSNSATLPVIAPRNERESEFWQMLSSDVHYKITALAKEWGVAPNTLRNWKERWNSANLNSQLQPQSGD